MRKLAVAFIIVLALASFAAAGTVETAQALANASQKFNDTISAFNNEHGKDGSAQGMSKLYAKYGLSDPPTTGEYNAMSVKDRADFFFELWSIIDRALQFEDIRNDFIIIDPGTGAFGSLATVKTWAEANMGAAGVQVGKNTDVLATVRATLAPFVEASTLKFFSDAITGFRDAVTSDINNRGTG